MVSPNRPKNQRNFCKDFCPIATKKRSNQKSSVTSNRVNMKSSRSGQCPYFFQFTSFKGLGQKSLQKFRWFFGPFGDTQKGYFEINWLLGKWQRQHDLKSLSKKYVSTLLQPARSRIYLKLKIQVKMELSFSGAEGQDEQLMDCTTITTAFYFMSPPRAFLKLQPLRRIHKIC